MEKKSENVSGQQIVSVSGAPLELGPSARLMRDKLDLYRELNMIIPPPKVSLFLVLSVEALLLVGFLLRVFTIYYTGQMENIWLDSILNLSGGQYSFEQRKYSVKMVHVLITQLAYLVLLPQAFILMMRSKNSMSNIWQVLIISTVMIIAVVNHAIIPVEQSEHDIQHQNLSRQIFSLNTEAAEKNCSSKHICIHLTAAVYSNVFILLPLLNTVFTSMFACRMKQWIARLKVVGPAIIFFSSTRSRDLMLLAFQMFVMAVSISGMTYFSQDTVHNYIDKPQHGTTFRVLCGLLDVAANIVSILGGFGIIVLFLDYHNKYSHGDSVVSERVLDLKIRKLIEDHRDVLVSDLRPSRNKYFPQTCGVDPVVSGQLETEKKIFLKFAEN